MRLIETSRENFEHTHLWKDIVDKQYEIFLSVSNSSTLFVSPLKRPA